MLYNRLDNRILSEINEYVDFNRSQSSEIKELVQRFHHWHRTTQLPIYAELIRSMAEEIETNQNLGFDQFEIWAAEIEQMARNTNNCHPMMYSFDLMKSLTDEQVEQAKAQMLDEYSEHLERYEKRTEKERFERRRGKMLVWLKRFKLDLNEDELALLDQSFADQIDLADPGFLLWKEWDSHFYQLLLKRDDDAFNEKMRNHIHYFESMLEESYPTEIQQNRQIWRQFFYQLALDEALMDKSEVPAFLVKLANNLSEISKDVPKSQIDWNAADYCSQTK